MKKTILILSMALLSFAAITTSCSKDDNAAETAQNQSILTLTFETKNVTSYKELTVEALEINSGKKITKTVAEASTTLTLDRGSYKISVNGTVVLESGETVQVGGNGALNVNQPTQDFKIDLSIKAFSEDFIIEEVFFAGVRTTEGKLFTGGRYFKLTNNTDKVLKTGGLLICQSELNTSGDHNVSPYIKEEAFPVKAVLMIPENFSKNVEPGDFIVIADMAMNHETSNIPAFDLSKADYEYPNLDNPKLGQADNPAVPNANVIYSAAAFNMFFVNDRGNESYAIARFPAGTTVDTWLKDYTYEYEYPNQAGNITKKKAYKIPNKWIIDGVNSAPTTTWLQNQLSTSIDSGWTGCGTINSDPERYGKAIRRKAIGTMANGKNIYKDTNNSTIDFNRDASPSLKKGIVH